MNIKRLIFLGLVTTSFPAAAQRLEVQDVVVIALEKSFDVQLSRNTAAVAEANAHYSKGLFLPDLTANASRTWQKQNSKQILADNSEKDVNNIKQNSFNPSVQMTWTLFDGLRMFALYKGYQQVDAVNEVLLKSQMANTMGNVIGNYYNIVAQKQQLRAINEQIAVSEERIKLAERKLQVGAGIKTELLQAKLDQNAFKTSALQQEAVIAQIKANLNTISGNQLPAEFEVSDTIPLNLDLTIEEILEGIESTSPALIAARGNIEASKFNIKAQKGLRFPTLNFISGYNINKNESNQATNQFSPISSRTNGFQYGFNGSWIILNNFAISNTIQLARIDLQRQQVIYEQQKSIAVNGVRSAYANYDNARKTLAIEEENIQLARENVSILLETFKRGATTFIELRTAQQSMVDAYNRLTTARYNAKVSETELLRLKGALLR
jgi:outer membrane protein